MTKNTKQLRLPSLTTGMIRFLMLPIMIICIGASVRFSAFWHIYIGINFYWSWGLSGAFILMANIMFSLGMGRKLSGIVCKYSKGERLALILWGFITIYSMATSVAAQFNRHLEKQQAAGIVATSTDQVLLTDIIFEIEKARNPEPVYNKDLLDGYNESIRLLQEEQAGVNTGIRDLGPMPDRSDYGSDKEYSTARWYWYDTKNKYDIRLTEIRESLSEYQAKKEKLLLPPEVNSGRIAELEERRDELLDKGAKLPANDDTRGDDIFSWLSGIFGVRPDTIQFILSLFPALFIDLLAPVASAIFFYGLGGLGVKKESFTESDMQDAYREGAGVAFDMVRESLIK